MTARAPSASALTTSLPRRMPAVQQHLDLAADRRRRPRAAPGWRRGCRPGCCRRGWTPRSRWRRCPRTAGVVGPHDALDHERPAPLLAQPGDVGPARRRGLHPLAVHAEEAWARARPGRPCSARSDRAGRRTEPFTDVAGPRDALRGEAAASARRSIFSGIAGLPQSRPLENDQSRVTISALAPAGGPARSAARIASRSPDQ